MLSINSCFSDESINEYTNNINRSSVKEYVDSNGIEYLEVTLIYNGIKENEIVFAIIIKNKSHYNNIKIEYPASIGLTCKFKESGEFYKGMTTSLSYNSNIIYPLCEVIDELTLAIDRTIPGNYCFSSSIKYYNEQLNVWQYKNSNVIEQYLN